MIIEESDLARYRGRVALAGGGFDPLHHGHVAYLRAVADLGAPVLVSVDPDSYVARKHPPLQPQAQRAALLDALEPVELVYANPGTTAEVLDALRPRYYVKSRSWEGRLPAAELEICARVGTEVVHVDTDVASSSAMLSALILAQEDALLEAFEARMAAPPLAESRYDTEYFAGDWRAEGNDYRLETRRRIEARNPELIQQVFAPQRVLDLGCGPGALMALLAELGVDVDGVDFSPEARALAPESVRDRIFLGDVCGPLPVGGQYDLVISREVFEHLTIAQVRRAVTAMCRASSRYVYATTRFHQSPRGMLDVGEEPEVDPTHVTLLTQPMLRLLFVLEGLRRRPDLEQQLDWLGKGRVLVYEHPQRSA